MPSSSNDFLILASDLPADVLGGQIGSFDLKSSKAATAVPFTLLDSFDQAIRSGSRMLIETSQGLILYHDAGPLARDAEHRRQSLADLAPGPVKDTLQRLSPLRSLLAIGTGTIRRRYLSLIDDEGKTVARVELATLWPAGDGTPVTLTSLQGLRGYDEALEALRAHIGTLATPRLDGVTQLPDVLFPGNPAYVAKPDVLIAPDEAAFDAASDIIAAYIHVARRNEPGIIADHDTEFLHDYRVALRKIRSVLSLFRGVYSADQTAALKQAFSGLMAPTGRLRDLDVYLLGQDDYFAMLPDTLHEGLTLMFRLFAEERQREHEKLANLLRSAAYQENVAQLEALFGADRALAKGPEADQLASSYARKLIWKRYRKVCGVAATITAETPDEHVHELRILCKKLRYLMEFFAPLLPADDLKMVLKPLKGLQDNLGLFNDYSVQQAALQNFMERQAPQGRKQSLKLAQSVGALITVLHGRQKAERAKVMSSFAHFDSPEIRTKIRDLFHGKGA